MPGLTSTQASSLRTGVVPSSEGSQDRLTSQPEYQLARSSPAPPANPEHAMAGPASLVEQPADLLGGGCHPSPAVQGPAGCPQVCQPVTGKAKDPRH